MTDEKNLPWKRCPGCGEEFLMLAKSGKCGKCTEADGGHQPPPARKAAEPSLRDRVKAAREEMERQRFG